MELLELSEIHKHAITSHSQGVTVISECELELTMRGLVVGRCV